MILSFNIPDAQAQRLVDAICATNGYIDDGVTTRAQFAKKVILQNLKNTVAIHETTEATKNFVPPAINIT